MNRSLFTRLAAVLLIVAMPTFVFAGSIGRPSAAGGSMSWDIAVSGHDSIVLTVQHDGEVYTKTFKGAKPVVFNLKDMPSDVAVDGPYDYRLDVIPNIPPGLKKQLEAARATGDEKASQKAFKAAGIVVPDPQTGSFLVINGSILDPNRTEGGNNAQAGTPTSDGARSSSPSLSGPASRFKPEVLAQVIPDDLIVQGSTCTGFDCVSTESFGFDTLRLKENNLRIHFEDTSTSAGYPANDWRLVANDSTSGGANKFVIEDSTAARNPVTIEAAAPANALYVDSTGNIGFQQSAPLLDLHLTTSDTPALRLEQTNAGGFTAQTWDIGGNEANFFVRDLTGGSRLSFRIRPGAPTSSIDIAADGEVGIGTANPDADLDVAKTEGLVSIRAHSNNASGIAQIRVSSGNGTASIRQNYFQMVSDESVDLEWRFGMLGDSSFRISDFTTGVEANRVTINSSGQIGIGGVTSPTNPIQHSSGAILTAGGTWQSVSSRAAKKDISTLTPDEAKAALAKLQPVKFTYKLEPGDPQVGFIAEDVPDLVATHDRKHLNAMEITAVLTDVVKEQQKTIEHLQQRLDQLEKNNQ